MGRPSGVDGTRTSARPNSGSPGQGLDLGRHWPVGSRRATAGDARELAAAALGGCQGGPAERRRVDIRHAQAPYEYRVYVSLTSADGTVEYQPPPGYFYDPSVNFLASNTSREVGVVAVEELVAPTGETITRRTVCAIPDLAVEELGARAPILRKMDGGDLALRLERAERLAKDLDREGLHDEIYTTTSEDGYLHVGRLEREVRPTGHLLARQADVRTFDPESPGATADAAEHFGEMVRRVDERNAAKDAGAEWQFGACEAGRLARVDAQHRRVTAGRELERTLRRAAAEHGVLPTSPLGLGRRN